MRRAVSLSRFLAEKLRHLPLLFIGFFVISIGVQTMINTQLGLNPWGIFHSGVAHTAGITFGRASQLTGLTIILMCMFLRIYPGIGTLLNMFFIGYFVDLIASWDLLPHFTGLLPNILSFLFGNLLFSFGVYLYLHADLGSGPRDSLMLALSRLTRFTAGQCKIMMEATAAIIGFLLGGSVGIGTVLAAFTGGLFIDLFFKLFRYDPKTRRLANLVDDYFEIRKILSVRSS